MEEIVSPDQRISGSVKQVQTGAAGYEESEIIFNQFRASMVFPT